MIHSFSIGDAVQLTFPEDSPEPHLPLRGTIVKCGFKSLIIRYDNGLYDGFVRHPGHRGWREMLDNYGQVDIVRLP